MKFFNFRKQPEEEGSFKKKLQKQYKHVEKTPFAGSYQAFQWAMETFIEANGGTLTFNEDGSATIVSPEGGKVTVYYHQGK